MTESLESNTAMSIQRVTSSEFCRLWWLPVLLGCLTQAGCMSAITTAALRDALRDTVGAASEPATAMAADATEHDAIATAEATAAVGDATSPILPTDPAEPTLSLDEAVERAVERLSGVGQLDAATQATLLSMLESTNPKDWPAAIDAFAAALEANRPRQPAVTEAAAVQPEPEPVEPAIVQAPPAETVAISAALPVAAAVVEPVSQVAALVPQPVVLEPVPGTAADEAVAGGTVAVERLQIEPEEIGPQPGLAIMNPCFVSRVRAWGVVDRFPEQVFRPGQDVIVYFELQDLSSRKSPAGHATSIDSVFRLIDGDGQQIGQWKFEPVDETCHAPRSDYFARYFIRIPETAAAGRYRLEFAVTDRLAGSSTQTHLDLEVAAAD